MKLIRNGLFMMLLVFLFMLVACSSESAGDKKEDAKDSSTQTKDEGKDDKDGFGGVLKVALDAQPPTLDAPTTPATSARDSSRMIFETLVTTDKDYKAVPMLAETVDVSDDSKIYTFKLRQGVKFHNGKEMTSEDVVASMERWLEKSTITGTIFEGATWTAEDDYTVVLELAESSSLTLDTMASSKMGAAIMPKEIVEEAPAEGVEEYIGTGPYKFVEWKQDQYIHFTRYEDYQAVDSETSGLAGKKVAYFDDVYFYIVPDASTRLVGIQTGEYDFAYGLAYDSYDQLKGNPDLDTILTPSSNAFMHFNKNYGVTQNVKFREAVNTALDVDEIMMAAYPNKDLYWVDCGYMDVNIKNWASSAGCEKFNLKDTEKAKELLKEAGYSGEEFKIMLTRDYPQYYTAGVVIQEQLKNIGINAVIDVYDWPTFNDKFTNQHQDWDAFVVGISTVSTPPQLLPLSPTFAGGLKDEKVQEMLKAIETSPSLEEAQKLWDDLQQYAWEEVLPIINLGGGNALYGLNGKVEGITAFSGVVFWNAKFVE